MLSLFGGFAYLNGRIDRRQNVSPAYAGARFRLQPDYTGSGGASLRVPVGHGAVFYATPSATYQSKVSFELPNSDAISQRGYTLVNLRAGVELAGGRYRIGGFARNLTNKRYCSTRATPAAALATRPTSPASRASMAWRSAAVSDRRRAGQA